MKAVLRLFVLSLVCLTLGGLPAAAHAQATSNPSLWTTQPVPVNQEFDASFGYRTNVSAAGFWGTGIPPITVEGNTLRILFDEGCGWLCPSNDSAYRQFPFRLPALAAGTYVIRIEASPPVFAEFPLVVGGGPPAATALPVGGSATWLLGALLALVGVAAVRRINLSGNLS